MIENVVGRYESYKNRQTLADIPVGRSQSESDAGAYALMTIFGGAINLHQASAGSTTCSPLSLTTDANGNAYVSVFHAPQNKYYK